MDEPRMGDAFEGSVAEWDAYLAEWRRKSREQASESRNPKAGEAKTGPDPWAIEGE